MKRIITLMDVDKSGTLNYTELADAIAKAGKQDIGAQVMIMQLELKDISRLLQKSLATDGLINVDKALVLDGPPREEEACLGREEDATSKSTCSKSRAVSLFDSSSQPPSLVALDHQLRRLGQRLTDQLHAISTEAEQEVVHLASSARQMSFLSAADSSTVPPDSARSADKISDTAGKAADTLPSLDVDKLRQRRLAGSGKPHSGRPVLIPLSKDSSTLHTSDVDKQQQHRPAANSKTRSVAPVLTPLSKETQPVRTPECWRDVARAAAASSSATE